MKNEIPVSEKVKKLREKKGLSLQDVSSKTGFSTAILSQIENHLISPPLGTLVKLAHALEVPVGYFFSGKATREFSIVRRDERTPVSRFASKDGVKYGYNYHTLCPEQKDRHMEPFLITLEPATTKIHKLSVHEGEEFIFVLEGEMKVQLGEYIDYLQQGDSIYYNSEIPHQVSCEKGDKTLILAVIYPG